MSPTSDNREFEVNHSMDYAGLRMELMEVMA